MEINMDEIWTGWMTWEQIEPYKEQIIDMELEAMTVYHYPERDIPRSYPEQKVAELRQHLADGNTYFWGAIYQGKLLGYCWGYTTMFIDHLRWCGRSAIFVPEARGLGLGTLAIKAREEKARDLDCNDISVMYAVFNERIGHILEKVGFRPKRIEVVKKLKD